MEELKPCPFCGCEATHEYDSDWGLVVRCTLCGAIMTDTLYPIKQEAITAWNQRAERTCEGCVIPDRDYGHAPSPCNFCVRNYEERYDLYTPAKVAE